MQAARRIQSFVEEPAAPDVTSIEICVKSSLDSLIKKSLRDDEVVKVPGLLDADQLARAKACFEWSISNPGPLAIDGSVGANVYRIDNLRPNALDVYRETVLRLPLADLAMEVWGSDHVWYYREETFWREGTAPRTFWHQDTSYTSWMGEHFVNCWTCFDRVPKGNSIEVIRGSHHGPLYDGTAFDENDPTKPLWGDRANLPRLPDIEADRKRDPASWNVAAFDIEPGDVVFFIPGVFPVADRQTRGVRSAARLSCATSATMHTGGICRTARASLSEDQLKATLPSGKRGRPGELFRSSKYLQVR